MRRLRTLYGEMFSRGERNKLPAKAEETVWLRFCAEMAGQGTEVDAGRYRYLAELYFELHPKDKPHGGPLTPAYEQALERHSWRIRKNWEYWEKRLKPYLTGAGESHELTSPSDE